MGRLSARSGTFLRGCHFSSRSARDADAGCEETETRARAETPKNDRETSERLVPRHEKRPSRDSRSPTVARKRVDDCDAQTTLFPFIDARVSTTMIACKAAHDLKLRYDYSARSRIVWASARALDVRSPFSQMRVKIYSRCCRASSRTRPATPTSPTRTPTNSSSTQSGRLLDSTRHASRTEPRLAEAKPRTDRRLDELDLGEGDVLR